MPYEAEMHAYMQVFPTLSSFYLVTIFAPTAQIVPHRMANPALRLVGTSVSSLHQLPAPISPRTIHRSQNRPSGPFTVLRCIAPGHKCYDKLTPRFAQP